MKTDSVPLIQDAQIPLSPAELEVKIYRELSCNLFVNIVRIRSYEDNISKKGNTLQFKQSSTTHGV